MAARGTAERREAAHCPSRCGAVVPSAGGFEMRMRRMGISRVPPFSPVPARIRGSLRGLAALAGFLDQALMSSSLMTSCSRLRLINSSK